MRVDLRKKMAISAITFSLVLGGSSLYAFAQDSSSTAAPTTNTQPSGSTQDIQKGDHKRGFKQGFGSFEQSATILGVDQETLKQSLNAGKSLVDIAKEKGISEADLIQKLTDASNTRLDEAVKSGKLTQEKADEIKKNTSTKLKDFVNQKGFKEMGNHKGGRGHGLGKISPDKTAKILGITQDELNKQLDAGKSLADIASSRGISEDQLISKIKDEMTPNIKDWVERKKTDKQVEKNANTN
jgi:hypothetical protein